MQAGGYLMEAPNLEATITHQLPSSLKISPENSKLEQYLFWILSNTNANTNTNTDRNKNRIT